MANPFNKQSKKPKTANEALGLPETPNTPKLPTSNRGNVTPPASPPPTTEFPTSQGNKGRTFQIGNEIVSEATYNAVRNSLGFPGGFSVPKAPGIVDPANVQRLTEQANNPISPEKEKLLQELGQPNPSTQPVATNPSITSAGVEPLQPSLSDAVNLLPSVPGVNLVSAAVRGNIPSIPQIKATFTLANAKESGEAILREVASIYDFVYSLTQGGKGIQQKEAEQTFAKLEGDIIQDLALVQQGLKSPLDVKKKIDLMEDANSRLEQSVKGLNGFNLRYFLTDGADVQANLINNKDNIQDFRNQLRAIVAGQR